MWVLIVAIIGVIVFFYVFSAIKSDERILKTLNKKGASYEMIHTSFEGIKYRYVVDTQAFDPQKPTMIFIHGAIGSSNDFREYFKDDTLYANANLITFDRPNYGPDVNPGYEHTIDFEADLTNDLRSRYRSEVQNMVVGYSYGGPIALVAHDRDPYDAVVLMAPAVDPDNEVMPFPLVFYRSPILRPLVPKAWKEASKEKLGHVEDLEQYRDLWETLEGNIVHIHGDNDILVPYENVSFLQERIAPEYYTLYSIPGAGHGFVWGSFEELRDIIIEQI